MEISLNWYKISQSVLPAQPQSYAPLFYSQVYRILEQRMPNIATPQQVMGILQGRAKQDEINYLGLPAFLSAKNKITRQELLDYVKSKELRIEETIKSRNNEENERDVETLPKYETYTLPGGADYRELLARLPVEKRKLSFEEWYKKEYGQAVFSERTMEIVREYYGEYLNRGEDTIDLSSTTGRDDVFNSGHWDEPNVLAHTRFKKRKDTAGKEILFLEELQSDWHQTARKKGYKPSKERINEISKRMGEIEEAQRQLVNKNVTDVKLGEEWQKLNTELRGVPMAPLRETKQWTAMLLNRMIRWAVENGINKIGWTTGKQQAERYDLGAYVDEITWYRHMSTGEPLYSIFGKKNGVTIIEKPDDGRYIDPNDPDEGLEAYVGKDLAQKIISSPGPVGSIKGKDLKIGVQGMEEYYDRIMPSLANRLGKLFGSSPKKEKINHDLVVSPIERRLRPDGFIGSPAIGAEYTFYVVRHKTTGLKYGEPHYDSEEDAQSYIDSISEVWTMNIPPEMAQKYLYEGVPHFSKNMNWYKIAQQQNLPYPPVTGTEPTTPQLYTEDQFGDVCWDMEQQIEEAEDLFELERVLKMCGINNGEMIDFPNGVNIFSFAGKNKKQYIITGFKDGPFYLEEADDWVNYPQTKSVGLPREKQG